jgi:glycosyltransferase involved in cell wall biosynthesis
MKPYLIIFLPSLEGGGAERAFVELANQFVKLGVNVDFVCAKLKGQYIDEVNSGIKLVDLSTTNKFIMLIRLIRYIRKKKPDAILSGLDMPNIITVLACIISNYADKCFISERTVLSIFYKRFHPIRFIFLKPLFKYFYSNSKLIICNSYSAKVDLINNLGIRESKCHVIHNSVDIEQINILSAETINIIEGRIFNKPFLCAIGSLTTLKDFATLFRAFCIVRKSYLCNLVVLGEGKERRELEKLAVELNIDKFIIMPGFDKNPYRWLFKADVFISSSLLDGCPNALLQALACGTPIVATDCPGGTAEILENGKWGRLIKLSDPNAMANAILDTVYSNSPKVGRLRATDFDPTKTAKKYLEIIFPHFNTST